MCSILKNWTIEGAKNSQKYEIGYFKENIRLFRSDIHSFILIDKSISRKKIAIRNKKKRF